jgi:uncharacterized protein YgiM (DUF1202 family)
MLVSSRMARGQQRHTIRRAGSQSLVWRIAAVAILLSLAMAAAPVQRAAASSDSYINTDVLNLRDDAGTWANVIDRMYQNEPVSVLDGPTDDGWYFIDYYGEQGWAYGGYLVVNGSQGWADASAGSDVGGVGSSAWVSTNLLNVRTDASSSAGVLDQLATGAEVYVTGTPVNGFVPIDYNGQTAYVWSDYLSFDGPVDSGPERWIDVDRSNQTVTLYVGDEPVASYWAAMGYDHSDDGFYSTAIGTYYVYSKYKGLSWTEWGQTYIEDWVGFDPSRVNGFHSFSMDSSGNVLANGDGQTGGCVAMSPDQAAAVFDFATVGMRVEVHR